MTSWLLALLFLTVYGADTSYYSYNPDSPVGPSNWDQYFPVCGGRMQSPIDIVTKNLLGYPIGPLKTTTSDSPVVSPVIIDDHTVEVVVPLSRQGYLTGSTLLGDQYQLTQFHYHAPSEHTINGIPFDLEVHYVHQHKATGLLAAVSVLYQDGSFNADLQPLVDTLNAGVSENSTVTMSVQFPTYEGGFYYYRGSLTTPPCSQTVSWFVSQNVLQLSRTQLNTIVSNLDQEGFGNSRPVQPLNGRSVYQYVTTYSYNPFDPTAPKNWASYWPTCGGLRQSPINIVTANAKRNHLTKLVNHASGALQTETLLNTGFSVEVEVAEGGHRRNSEELWPSFEDDLSSRSVPSSAANEIDGSTLLLDKFSLLQFHYHSPSEHSVDGNFYPLEVHYVHRDIIGRYAVVAFFYEVTTRCNPDLEAIVSGLSAIPNRGSSASINVKVQYPVATNYWHYVGSLTTPPCLETVNWYVYQQTQPICSRQLQALQALMVQPSNSRPVQPLNNRTVYIGSGSGLGVSMSMVVAVVIAVLATVL